MSWHVDGELTGQGLDRPYFSTHVSSGTDSLLAVTDTMNHRIVLFRGLGGEVVRILGEGALRCPMGIVAHPKDRMVVYVVDMGSTRLLKMSLLDGRVMASVGSHGTGPGELRSPQGVAVSGRLIFVCDTSNNRVCVFEDSSFMGLNFSHAFGTKGSAPGELLGPTGVAVLGERVFVTERYNHRVSVFDDDGALVRCIGGHRSSAPGFFNEPFGVALLPPAGARARRARQKRARRTATRPARASSCPSILGGACRCSACTACRCRSSTTSAASRRRPTPSGWGA